MSKEGKAEARRLLSLGCMMDDAVADVGGELTQINKREVVSRMVAFALSKPELITADVRAQLDLAIREVGGGDSEVVSGNAPEAIQALGAFAQQWARTIVPLERQVFMVTIDGRLSIAEMVESTGCPYKHPDILKTEYKARFAGTGEIFQRRLRLVPFKKDFSNKEALALVTNDQGHIPTYEDGLAFSAQFPDVQRKVPIPVLDPDGPLLDRVRHALVLVAGDVGRGLHLSWFEGDWSGFCWGLALCNNE